MMKIWRYEESSPSHTLVKLYAENHGEGEFLGEFSDEEVEALILGIKPDANILSELQRLKYYGFLPLLVIHKT